MLSFGRAVGQLSWTEEQKKETGLTRHSNKRFSTVFISANACMLYVDFVGRDYLWSTTVAKMIEPIILAGLTFHQKYNFHSCSRALHQRVIPSF